MKKQPSLDFYLCRSSMCPHYLTRYIPRDNHKDAGRCALYERCPDFYNKELISCPIPIDCPHRTAQITMSYRDAEICDNCPYWSNK